MNRYIAFTSIKIAPNRQRQEHDINAHQELVESISKLGLLHPPVLRLEGESYSLVAGERRLRAMGDIIALGGRIKHSGVEAFDGMVPYTFLGDLSPLEIEEAELDENIKRVDLTWQERASATARLEVLRNKQAEARGEKASRVELVAEIRGKANANDQTKVRMDILLAGHLDKPEVAKAKNAREAFKALKNVERADRNVALAKSVGKTLTGNSHTLLNEDSIAWMFNQPNEVYDVILTDPPYGMGADDFNDSGGLAAGAHGYADDYETFMRAATAIAFDGFRITKPEAHLYCFCDIDKFSQLRALVLEAGWSPFRTPIIWSKPNGQRAPWPDQGPQRKYEVLLFATKGKKKVNVLKGDVLTYPTEENLGHSAQKPVGLYLDLLSRSVNPGDKVLDPFAGTGPIIPAAHGLKCLATAVERDAGSYGIMVNRLKGLS